MTTDSNRRWVATTLAMAGLPVDDSEIAVLADDLIGLRADMSRLEEFLADHQNQPDLQE